MIKFFLKIIPIFLFIGFVILVWSFIPSNIFKSQSDAPVEVINHNTILESIEALGKLELVKYNFKEVTELTEKNRSYLGLFKVPDSKAVLITNGQAVGCINLKSIAQEDIIIEQDTLYIKLPQPELCFYKLDLNSSRIYSVEKTVYYKDDKKLIEKAYRMAENQIKDAALRSGILEQTSNNAEVMLRPLLEQVSGKKVAFIYSIHDKTVIGRREVL
ncbi:MAG: DUF4230 domain-containing protein [Bacteroidota bacterium]|jgi:hypothetical protein|nr:DUF4230 domain-containing protein [Bacteroidota bacterium]